MSVLQGSFCRFNNGVNFFSNYNKHIFPNSFANASNAFSNATSSFTNAVGNNYQPQQQQQPQMPQHQQINNFATTSNNFKSSVEEKLGIRPKPKKPTTAFLRYITRVKPTILQQNPNINIKDLHRMAGEQWRTADPQLKLELQEQYKADWAKYVEACKEYDKMLSPGERQEIKLAHLEAKEMKEKRKLRKKAVDMGKPKRPGSSFVLFMQSRMVDRGNMPFKEFQQKVGKEWEGASEVDKQKFTELYRREMELYKAKLASWEQQMMKAGQHELVRRRP